MYSQMTLDQLAAQAKKMSDDSHDVVANSTGLTLSPNPDGFWLTSTQVKHPLAAVMNDIAHDQIATRFGIPQRYYEKCRAEMPVLACENVNRWMQHDPKDVMVRMLRDSSGDGDAVCRAVLSNRYLRLDNHEVLNAFMGGIARAQGLGRVGVLGGTITDKRMYVNLLFEGTQFDVPGPDGREDPHYLGVRMSNSEVGYGAASVHAFVYRSYCTNGLVFGKRDLMGFERRHVGQVRGYGELSPETHRKIAEVLISAAADVGRALATEDTRERLIEPLRAARRSAEVQHPEPAFEVLAKSIGLTDGEREKALEHFIREQDYTKFGAAQAITWLGNDESRDSERVQELTEKGGDIINLPASHWRTVAEAA